MADTKSKTRSRKGAKAPRRKAHAVSHPKTDPARERVDPERFLAEVRAARERQRGVHITDEFLRAAKDEGRP